MSEHRVVLADAQRRGHREGDTRPACGFGLQLFFSSFRQRVELGATIRLGVSPARADAARERASRPSPQTRHLSFARFFGRCPCRAAPERQALSKSGRQVSLATVQIPGRPTDLLSSIYKTIARLL